METWYNIVRKLQDESEDKYLTRKFCEDIFHDLYNNKLREKQKFKNRMGPEFDQWVTSLSQEYPIDMVREIIADDEFWNETLMLTQGV